MPRRKTPIASALFAGVYLLLMLFRLIGAALSTAAGSGTSRRQSLLSTSYSSMNGVEFEGYLVKVFTYCGYSVKTTRATGDFGADLIAKKDGRKIVIQAKRWKGSVGNKAVQEAFAARQHYGGDEAWVVAASTFTPAAKTLARSCNVKLIDGYELKKNCQNNLTSARV